MPSPAATQPAEGALRLPQVWPGATYKFTGRNGSRGTISQRNERVKEDGQDRLKLTDVMEMEGGGAKVRTIYTTLCCPDEYLTPVRITADEQGAAPGAEASRVMDLQFDNASAVGTVRGRAMVIDAPHPLVTELALFRVVALMPTRGAELKFSGFQSTTARPLGQQSLRCTGRERVRVAGRDYDAWKFEHTGPGIRPSTYWVNSDGFFLKALLAGTDEWVYAPRDDLDHPLASTLVSCVN